MVQQGVDLYAVGQILGHKTARMTQRYAHLSPDYMAGAVNKLDGIMGGMLPSLESSNIVAAATAERMERSAMQLSAYSPARSHG